MWFILVLFYFYQFFLRVYPSVLFDELMQYMDIGAASLGTLVGCYYYVYTVLQIPGGLFLDKFGVKTVAVASILCCAIGSFLFVCSTNYYIALIGRGLTGLGSSCSFCSCLKIATNWFKPKQIGFMTTLTVSLGCLGPIFGVPMFAKCLKVYDWISVLYIISALGIVLAILTALLLQDSPSAETSKKDPSLKFIDGICTIFGKKNMLFMLAYGFCAYAPVSAFADMWGVPFLKIMYPALTTVQASVLTNALYVGMIFGPLLSPIAEKFGKTRVMTLSAAGMALPFFLLISNHSMPYCIAYTCIFVVGFFTTGQLFTYPIAYDTVPAKLSGLVSGILNAGAMLSGSILQPMLGKILELAWDGSIVDGAPYYNLSCYKAGFMVVTALLIIAMFIPYFITEKDPDKTESA